MEVAILGAGGVGLGMAALVASKDMDVSLWGPTSSGIEALLDGKPLVSKVSSKASCGYRRASTSVRW